MKGVPSSPVQCIGSRCTKQPTIENQLGKKIQIRGTEVDKIFACVGHQNLVEKIAKEQSVSLSRFNNPERLIVLQNEALERGTVRGNPLPLEMKKQIGKWRESRHGRSPEQM